MRRSSSAPCLAAALLLAGAASPAFAEVFPAIIRLEVQAGHNAETELLLDVPGTLDDDAQVTLTGPISRTTYENLARAETHGGLAPQAIAFASSRLITDRDYDAQGTGTQSGRRSRAHAFLQYTVSYLERQPPPGEFPARYPLPIKARWSVSAEVSGDIEELDTTSFVEANTSSFLLSIGTFQVAGAVSPTSPLHEDGGALETSFNASGNLSVTMAATARVGTAQRVLGFGDTTSIEAQVVVDPFFEFDQERFEAIAQEEGFEPFDLAEHFALQYSPRLVPEPGAAGPLVAALAGLLLASFRERGRAQSHHGCSARSRRGRRSSGLPDTAGCP